MHSSQQARHTLHPCKQQQQLLQQHHDDQAAALTGDRCHAGEEAAGKWLAGQTSLRCMHSALSRLERPLAQSGEGGGRWCQQTSATALKT
jgi:hypothetical protein